MYFISTYKDLKCDVYINNCIELSWVQVDVVCADKKCITSSCFSDVHHTLCESQEIWTGQNRSPILWYVVHTNHLIELYEKRIKILHGLPFEGWPNMAWPIQPISQFLPKRVGWPCPVRSALKRTPVQDFNSFSIIISTTYQKIGDLFCPGIFLDIAQCDHVQGLVRHVECSRAFLLISFWWCLDLMGKCVPIGSKVSFFQEFDKLMPCK